MSVFNFYTFARFQGSCPGSVRFFMLLRPHKQRFIPGVFGQLFFNLREFNNWPKSKVVLILFCYLLLCCTFLSLSYITAFYVEWSLVLARFRFVRVSYQEPSVNGCPTAYRLHSVFISTFSFYLIFSF